MPVQGILCFLEISLSCSRLFCRGPFHLTFGPITHANKGQGSEQRAIHHQSIHEAQAWVMKRPREPADNLESEATPQVNRRFVGADHKIELHGPEAALAGSRKRVLA